MLKISEFSKLSHLTIKALRFYEKNGFKLSQGTVCMFSEIEDQM